MVFVWKFEYSLMGLLVVHMWNEMVLKLFMVGKHFAEKKFGMF